MQKVKRASAGRAHLTTRQAAGHCRVSIPTLRRWIRAGDLGAYLTPGGHRRIDLDEFQRFLVAQGRPPYPLGAGADACVTKPLDPDAVARELDRLVTSTRVSHSLTKREG